ASGLSKRLPVPQLQRRVGLSIRVDAVRDALADEVDGLLGQLKVDLVKDLRRLCDLFGPPVERLEVSGELQAHAQVSGCGAIVSSSSRRPYSVSAAGSGWSGSSFTTTGSRSWTVRMHLEARRVTPALGRSSVTHR